MKRVTLGRPRAAETIYAGKRSKKTAVAAKGAEQSKPSVSAVPVADEKPAPDFPEKPLASQKAGASGKADKK